MCVCVVGGGEEEARRIPRYVMSDNVLISQVERERAAITIQVSVLLGKYAFTWSITNSTLTAAVLNM